MRTNGTIMLVVSNAPVECADAMAVRIIVVAAGTAKRCLLRGSTVEFTAFADGAKTRADFLIFKR